MTTETQPPPRFMMLVFLAMVSVLPLNMFVPSLPRIAEDFNVPYAVVNVAIGGYAVVMAMTQIVGGALSDKYGRRPVALGSLSLFTLASIGCTLAPNAEVFLAFRMMQGTVTASQAVALSAIRDSWHGTEMTSRIGTISSAWAFGPMLGPTVGGILAAQFGWRSNFVLFSVLGTMALMMVFLGFRETNHHRTQTLFAWEEYRGFAGNPRFWAYSLLMMLATGSLYIYLGGAPMVAEQLGGLSTTAVGVMIGLVPTGFMMASFIASRTSTRFAPERVIIVGRSIMLAAMLMAMAFSVTGVTHPLSFFVPCLFIGFGNGLTLPLANAGVLRIARSGAGTALGLATAITVSGAALLSSSTGFAVEGADPRRGLLTVLILVAALAVAIAGWIATYDRWQPRLDGIRTARRRG